MTVFKLKIIACAAMLIDHIGAAIMLPMIEDANVVTSLFMSSYWLMRYVGRVAFPIFAYLIANGGQHTKSVGKYMLRLGALAIVSELLFDIAFRSPTGINFLSDTNIFYTLFLGVAAIFIYEKVGQGLKKLGEMSGQFMPAKILAVVAALPMLYFALRLGTDYSYTGVGLILAIYIIRPENKIGSCIAMVAGMIILYHANILLLVFSLIAVVLIAVYNGKPGLYNQKIKWGFYLFYPAHLAALIAVRAIIL